MWFLDGHSWQELRPHVGSLAQLAGIDRFSEEDGPARGSRRYQVRSGSGLVFDVLPDRGLDLGTASFRGVPLTWSSPSGHVAPGLTEQRGTEWQRAFGGGLLTTCGLDQFGSPNTDDGAELGQHGRASALPAQEVNTHQERFGDGFRFGVTGRLRQARLFGENLRLERAITTQLGSSEITLSDVVTNDGFEPQPHMVLYHMNLGWPLLDAGSTLRVGGNSPSPRNAAAERNLSSWSTFSAPETGVPEQVFWHGVDAPGTAEATLSNPGLGLGLSVRFDTAELPGLFQWKLMATGSYVLGLEPANSPVIDGRSAARAAGMLPILEPGESRSYTITIAIAVD